MNILIPLWYDFFFLNESCFESLLCKEWIIDAVWILAAENPWKKPYKNDIGCLIHDIWVSSFFWHFHGKFHITIAIHRCIFSVPSHPPLCKLFWRLAGWVCFSSCTVRFVIWLFNFSPPLPDPFWRPYFWGFIRPSQAPILWLIRWGCPWGTVSRSSCLRVWWVGKFRDNLSQNWHQVRFPTHHPKSNSVHLLGSIACFPI